ncbi:MAG: tetratricopeptide repeat protein [Cyanobacteria bacterium SIG26]|nr:tetratricopeptide repeat protein [Cyanobacteria bacterium SIG26]
MKRFVITLLLFLGMCSFSFGFAAEQIEEEIDITSQQAKVLYAQNEIDEALKLLKSKGEEYRTAEDWLIIGNILQDKDRLDEAVYMFKKAIEKEPKYYKAHYNLGYIYLIQDKPNMALDEFKKAVKYKDDFAYGYYNMGCAYLKLKEYRNARYNFFRAVDVKNDEPMFYYNLAYTFKMLNKEKQAQTYLEIYNKLMERQG